MRCKYCNVPLKDKMQIDYQLCDYHLEIKLKSELDKSISNLGDIK